MIVVFAVVLAYLKLGNLIGPGTRGLSRPPKGQQFAPRLVAALRLT